MFSGAQYLGRARALKFEDDFGMILLFLRLVLCFNRSPVSFPEHFSRQYAPPMYSGSGPQPTPVEMATKDFFQHERWQKKRVGSWLLVPLPYRSIVVDGSCFLFLDAAYIFS